MNTDTSSSQKTSSSSSSNNGGATSATLSALGNIIKLLPTGTVFVFEFANPIVTNNGKCNTTNKWLSSILLVACGFCCIFSSFTDSYTGTDNQRHYGIVTCKGLWPAPVPPANADNLSKYRLKFGDFVYAALSLLVFAVLGLLDINTVHCFYPSFDQSTQKQLIQVLPAGIGALSAGIGALASFLSTIFPNNRHGVGYPLTSDPNDTPPTSKQIATTPQQSLKNTV